MGAIDLGTNTVLLLVARQDPGGELVVLHEESSTARLGQGLTHTGELSEAGLERTLAALRRYVDVLRELGVPPERVRAVGTAVLRRARDAGRLVERVRAELDLVVEVLSEEDEARLGHAALVADGMSEGTLALDVGGGSTELVADHGRLRLSVPVGAVVATERWGLDAPRPGARARGLARCFADLERRMRPLPAGCAAGAGARVCLLGGSAVNLACIDRGLARFDPAAAEGHVLVASAARGSAERLVRLDPADRRRLPIEADRAEILAAGLACIAAALERLGAPGARVSARGLRYGVARELLSRPAVQGADPAPGGPWGGSR